MFRLTAIAMFLSATGFAKIGYHSNQQALLHAFKSKELTDAATRDPLRGLELQKLTVEHTGEGLGSFFRIEMVYSGATLVSATETVDVHKIVACSLAAEVRVEKDTNAPGGVSASRLGKLKVSKPTCSPQIP